MRVHGAEMGYPIPDVVVDGEVIEADPPRRLVQTWRMLMDPTKPRRGKELLALTHSIVNASERVFELVRLAFVNLTEWACPRRASADCVPVVPAGGPCRFQRYGSGRGRSWSTAGTVRCPGWRGWPVRAGVLA
jgi:hypothetical protein